MHATNSVGKRIYELLKSQITQGLLPVGAKLPSTRALALEKGVARSTVVSVYEQLTAEGYLVTNQGAVSRVAIGVSRVKAAPDQAVAHLKKPHKVSAYSKQASKFDYPQAPLATHKEGTIHFLYGALSSLDFPILAWRRVLDAALRQRQPRLYYANPQGELVLREELAGYLRRARGLVCEASQIVIVNGSQQAIDLCTRVLVDPQQSVVMEEPGYAMAHHAFSAAGARIQKVPVDANGLKTLNLPRKRVALAYVTPSHQYPLGGVLPMARRHALLAWAKQAGAWIVEDDYDGEFRYGLQPIDALQSIDTSGSVIYIGTFSKTLSPQLRIGYLVLPAALVSSFIHAKNLADRHTPQLEQTALAAFIHGGIYERHIRRARRANELRRAALIQAIKQYLPTNTQIEGDAAGLHLVVWLKQVSIANEALLVDRAATHAVCVKPISPMYSAGETHRQYLCAGLILGYAGLTISEIDTGIARLAKALKSMHQTVLR